MDLAGGDLLPAAVQRGLHVTCQWFFRGMSAAQMIAELFIKLLALGFRKLGGLLKQGCCVGAHALKMS
ncbi:MAG TPA: hypothetical protein DDZ88_13235 [Verrucomicrobiales bacterium]|nr:hypothetical protein [Verrucomicrobiales bacterium]